MNKLTMTDCSLPSDTESGTKKTGKIICGWCILLAMAIPVVLVIIALAAKLHGYF
ncbi:hypothetical protein [Sulfuricystis multivorans]|uniref:hypothetical protein n=1 Tax=Sulfuricystis multivorans TaxID=2211108 RepID=UPI001558C4D4|nr:hypothetical protein [Sulfuricystis multivorans]